MILLIFCCDLEYSFDIFRDNKLILKDNKIICVEFSIIS